MRFNAVKYGVTAQAVVIPGVESPEEYEAFHELFFAAHDPGCDAERIVLDRAVRLQWRIRRLERMEAQSVAVAIESVEPDEWAKGVEVWRGAPASIAEAREQLDRAREVAEIISALPKLGVGKYILPATADAVVACLADGAELDLESYRGDGDSFVTATQLQIAAKEIARAANVELAAVHDTGLRNAAALVDQAQKSLEQVESGVARLQRRARILPEAALYALSRHEAQLDRAYHRTMTEFQALKAAREGRDFPIHRLEIHA